MDFRASMWLLHSEASGLRFRAWDVGIREWSGRAYPGPERPRMQLGIDS